MMKGTLALSFVILFVSAAFVGSCPVLSRAKGAGPYLGCGLENNIA